MNSSSSTSLTPFVPGTQVFVSDGTPMPPARFNRLLRSWQSNNYEAVILAGGPDRYNVQRKPKTGWNLRGVMIYLTNGVPATEITPIENAELLPITSSRTAPTVDVTELLFRELKDAEIS